jgi:ribosomal protein S18 acetylase RimI-like enzyme
MSRSYETLAPLPDRSMDVEIRAITTADLALFDEHFDEGNPAQLARALGLQAEDAGVMLVAWLRNVPTGRVILHWRPVPEAPPNWEEGVAFLEELIVLEAYRSLGIGTAILGEAERRARQRGLARMAVGVGVDNRRARALYERLGYADAGLGVFEDSGVFTNTRGDAVHWEESWEYLIKAL